MIRTTHSKRLFEIWQSISDHDYDDDDVSGGGNGNKIERQLSRVGLIEITLLIDKSTERLHLSARTKHYAMPNSNARCIDFAKNDAFFHSSRRFAIYKINFLFCSWQDQRAPQSNAEANAFRVSQFLSFVVSSPFGRIHASIEPNWIVFHWSTGPNKYDKWIRPHTYVWGYVCVRLQLCSCANKMHSKMCASLLTHLTTLCKIQFELIRSSFARISRIVISVVLLRLVAFVVIFFFRFSFSFFLFSAYVSMRQTLVIRLSLSFAFSNRSVFLCLFVCSVHVVARWRCQLQFPFSFCRIGCLRYNIESILSAFDMPNRSDRFSNDLYFSTNRRKCSEKKPFHLLWSQSDETFLSNNAQAKWFRWNCITNFRIAWSRALCLRKSKTSTFEEKKENETNDKELPPLEANFRTENR